MVNFEVVERNFKSFVISFKLSLIFLDFQMDKPIQIKKLAINTSSPILKKKLQMLNPKH
jgi:hypothetical protein